MARLNILLDDDVYAELKRQVPAKRLSAFIQECVKANLRPSDAELARGYALASAEPYRRELEADWQPLSREGWPE